MNQTKLCQDTRARSSLPKKEALRRHHLAQTLRMPLKKKPSALNADTYALNWQQEMIVIKDCRYRPKLARPLIRWLLRRECKAYQRLYGTELVPEWLGWLDKDAFMLRYVPSIPISKLDTRQLIQANLKLQKSVEILHERRLFHMDLRSGGNILVAPGGRAYLVDLASMVKLKPWAAPFAWCFRRWDEYGLQKWRRRVISLLAARE